VIALSEARMAITANLSNQANTNTSKRTELLQLNVFAILGLGYIDGRNEEEKVPVSIRIDGQGKMTVSGMDGEIINDDNIKIYSDRKVTTSEK